MIITRAPHRVSYFGGGSDMIDHFTQESCHSNVFGSAIRLYSYIAIVEPKVATKSQFRLSYNRVEEANDYEDIEHDLFRETLKHFKINESLHISTFSDVPAGTGLGSSSAFLVALIKALSIYKGMNLSNESIFEYSVEIERNVCKHEGGVQDQYWATFGSIGIVEFKKDLKFNFNDALKIRESFSKKSFLIYLKGERSSESQQKKANASNDINEHRNSLSNISLDFWNNFNKKNSPNNFNNLFKDYLNQSWELKKKNIKLNENFSNLLHLLEKNQISFKLCGAGGTGFLYTFLDDKNSEEINKLICSLEGGYKLLPMKIDTKGVMQIF